MTGESQPAAISSTPDSPGVDFRSAAKGKLRLFLSYAAGAGKTRAMLAAADRRRAEGFDVAVAYMESRGQPDLTARLENLEVLPGKPVVHRDAMWMEMDIDAVLARRPQIVVIDDLAHVNVQGLRHPKRYQDVEELLENGIDVYATLNIYNLESLNDIVHQITGVRVRDTVPDRLFDETAEVELVDISPPELIRRLEEAYTFADDDSAQFSRNFFRLGNLMALRELCLRWIANRVDWQMRRYMHSEQISGPWPAAERLMVCISSHPLSERLVRAGSRLAGDLNAEWFVVYVETPDRLRFSPAHSERVTRTLRLAEDLGARVMTISGLSVPEAVTRFAREQNISKIIIGRPARPRWLELLNGSIVDDIISRSRSIDVYVISDDSGPVEKGIPSAWRPHSRLSRYILSTLLIVLVTLLGIPIHFFIEPTNLVMIYLLAVVASALYLGRGPSLLASFLGALAFDFFFVEPQLSFDVGDTEYLLTMLGLLGVSLVISSLAGQVSSQVEASQRREAQTTTVYALSRQLTVSPDLPAVLQTVVEHVSQTLARDVVILLPGPQGLEVHAASPGFVLEEEEKKVAAWCFEHAQPVGRGTDTLSSAVARYQPLLTSQGVVGVLGLRPVQVNSYLTPDQRQLLEAYSSLAALAIERARLAEQASQAQILSATEKLQTALLNAISHDLRTPLASITGVFSSLHEAELSNAGQGANTVIMDQETRLELLETGWEESERLNRLVGNLLHMTRLESGALRLRKEDGDIEDVIGAALSQLKNRRKGYTIKTAVPADRPLVPMDFVLIEQVLVNLVENAIKYSPPGSEIEICVTPLDQQMQVSVLDRGQGIPAEELSRVFDKFYRIPRRDNVAGTGLGLSICKGIVEAHGGQIWAENRPGGGSSFTFVLPLASPRATYPNPVQERSQPEEEPRDG